MGRKKIKESLKRKSISINLENWLWEVVDTTERNRSHFFYSLFIEDMKIRFLRENLILDSHNLSEHTGELYKLLIINKKQHLDSAKRRPIRRKLYLNKADNVLPDNKKTARSISLDTWIWDLIPYIVPNRSVYFQTLLENKIKDTLLHAGCVREGTTLTKCHGNQYCDIVGNQYIFSKEIS
jgi:hypothetical protein